MLNQIILDWADGHNRVLFCDRYVVDMLLKSGADVNDKDRCGRTALHEACSAVIDHSVARRNRRRFVTQLLEAGADISAECEPDGDTPLDCAAATGDEQLVADLIRRGANISSRQKDGQTPLHVAAGQPDVQVIEERKQKVRCNLCTEEKTFSSADALTRHYRVCHPDTEFPGKHTHGT